MINIIISDAITNFGRFHLLLRQIDQDLKDFKYCIHFSYFKQDYNALKNISYFTNSFWFGYETDGEDSDLYNYIINKKLYKSSGVVVQIPHKTFFVPGSLELLTEESARNKKRYLPKIIRINEPFDFQNSDIFSGYIPQYIFEKYKDSGTCINDKMFGLTNNLNVVFAEKENKEPNYFDNNDCLFFVEELVGAKKATKTQLTTDLFLVDRDTIN